MKGSFKLLTFEELNSTNDYLKTLAFEENLFVVAESQKRGRGRRGKNWISKKGKGIYLSGMFSLPSQEKISLLGVSFAVAVGSVVRSYIREAYLKWPNDVYVNGKKIAGILVETLRDRVIVGVGVNCYYLPEELKGLEVPATSFLAEGVNIEREKLLRELIESLICYKERLYEGDFSVSEFESMCPMIGRTVKVLEGQSSYLARVLGLDREGALVVEIDGVEGRRIGRIFSADVSIRLL